MDLATDAAYVANLANNYHKYQYVNVQQCSQLYSYATSA